jgi:hypothetical protein
MKRVEEEHLLLARNGICPDRQEVECVGVKAAVGLPLCGVVLLFAAAGLLFRHVSLNGLK